MHRPLASNGFYFAEFHAAQVFAGREDLRGVESHES
jgi:hypothetical protein